MNIGFTDQKTGEVLKKWSLIPSQEQFWTSKKKVVLLSGGYGTGKSLVLTLKAIEQAVKYPGNFILMGRRTYIELRDTLWKEFPIICPEELLKGKPMRGDMKAVFKNGSEIIFRHLDTVAEGEIRSMNLGSAFIDQAEDIGEEIVLGLQGRLRREGINDEDRQIFMSANPKLTWLYRAFKQEKRDDYELIEASTLENKENLPPGYVANLLKYPESYKKQYVYGVWDEDLLADKVVFDREYQERLKKYVRKPRYTAPGGLVVFEPFKPGHRYQMGVDPVEGAYNEKRSDEAAIVIVDLDELEEVASWTGKVPPDVVAEKVHEFALLFQDDRSRCQIVPEMNSAGSAMMLRLRQFDDLWVYQREDLDKTSGKRLKRYGWRMTMQSKPALISHFQELSRLANPIIHSSETVHQFRSFIYTDEAKKFGVGAQSGFHDDRVIATMLAFWEKEEARKARFIHPNVGVDFVKPGKVDAPVQPTLKIVNGKAVVFDVNAEVEEKSWLLT